MLMMLALEIAPLGDLRDWPPVGALAQTVLEAVAGVGGLSLSEIKQARAWSERWQQLHPDLKAFYVLNAPNDPVVTHCLRRLLDGGPEPKPGSFGHLAELWREQHGYDPPFPLWARMLRSSPTTSK